MHRVSGKSLTINQVTFNTNLVYTFICIYESNQILVKNVIFYLYDLNLVCKQDTYQIVLLRILTDPPCLCYIVQIIWQHKKKLNRCPQMSFKKILFFLRIFLFLMFFFLHFKNQIDSSFRLHKIQKWCIIIQKCWFWCKAWVSLMKEDNRLWLYCCLFYTKILFMMQLA